MSNPNDLLKVFEELLEDWYGSTEQVVLNMSSNFEEELDKLSEAKQEYKKRFDEGLRNAET